MSPAAGMPILAAAALLLGACNADSGIYRTPGGPEVGLTVFVRDVATHEPIEGAIVIAEVPSRDHPFSAATVFKQTGPMAWRAVTDQAGCAALAALEGRPLRLGVLGPDGEPWFRLFDPSPVDSIGPVEWHPIESAGGYAPRREVRAERSAGTP